MTEQRIEAVFHVSVQMLEQEMKKPTAQGGNMPVVSGNLYRSLLASRDVMPSIKSDGVFTEPNNTLTISGAELGQTIYLGFQAIYARRVNYGFTGTDSLGRTYNQTGRNFVGLAAQRWQQIVAEANFQVQKTVQSRQAGGVRGTVARQGRNAR
ncbi:hypothetical protein [Asticcacaulis endophyticus]|uniref:Uncharacterized protein n=1 Tax=Asticcacaulis endophyticus TaxID=1395890 RepID=A0A918PT10_9CAUL|nr:hypothetical protein [Asticcacaulis endophyticus]GGZ21737.1 hypothetical protein GCM10011273_03150 [Asticcacaulis endophyticus]